MKFFLKRSRIKGHFEGVAEGSARGWVFRPDQPKRPLQVEILDGDQVVATDLADQFRQDLLELGFGDGHHAFSIPLDTALMKSRTLTAREAATGQILTRPVQQSVLEQADHFVESSNKEAAITLLRENLCTFPDNQAIADKLLNLLGHEVIPSHLPGDEQWAACERSRRLLDIVLIEVEKQLQARGRL
ncbi:hypothetical protein [Desulfobulbus propionicus]